jgi:uncharacterized protein
MINTYLLATQITAKSMRSIVVILNKAQQWTAQGNISEETILNAKLAPDMFPFVKQIQMISDNAKGMASRLSGVEVPSFEDSETSLDQLVDRINRTIEFVKAIPAESFDNAEERKITLPYIPGKYMTAEEYIRSHGLPNFFFHMVTAYAILRNQGMSLGKMDYINDLTLFDIE